MSAISARFFLPAFIAATLLFVCLTPHHVNAFTCPGGQESHTASQAEADAASPKGAIVAGQTQVCPGDASVGINADAGKAKEDLQTMVCNSGVNISQLDDKFAVCADKFMQQLRQVSPGACVRDGYRSVQAQATACMNICNALSCPGKCAAPGHSYHQKGLAVDVSGIKNNQQSWQIAAANGIVNPAGLNKTDPNHFQSANSNCAGVPVPSGDNGDYYNDTNHFFPPAPSLPFNSQLRSALGLPPAPSALPAAPAAATPATTLPTTATPAAATPPALGTINTTPYPAGTCNPQTYCSQTDNNIYYRATTCVDQIYQKCTNGCSGVICNATSTASGSPLGGLLSPTVTNDNSNTNSNSNGTSTFDLIDFFANGGATATTIGTATPIDISGAIQDYSDASLLGPTSSVDGTPVQTPAQGSVAYGEGAQQTFTSGDLANSPGNYTYAQSTFAQQVLAQMKATLAAMLPYLQPFGGTVQTQPIFE